MAEHTGGMVALIPADPGPLLIDGGEPADELHVTLAYLGDDVTGWSDEQRSDILTAAQSMAAEQPGPIEARAFAHATFNPDGHADREPCAVYLIGDSGAPLDLHQRFAPLASADQHPGYVAHLTAGYGKTAADLTYTGPVTFDRLRVALGDDVHDFPLSPASDDEPATFAAARRVRTPAGRERYDKPIGSKIGKKVRKR